MKSFFRYISYIDFYHNHTKVCNVGFLRWKFQNEKHNIEIQIKDLNHLYGTFKIEEKKTKKILGNVRIDQGIGSFLGQFISVTIMDELFLNTEFEQIPLNEIEGFFIWLDENNYLFVPVNLPLEKKDSQKQEKPSSSELESASENILIDGIEEKYISTQDDIYTHQNTKSVIIDDRTNPMNYTPENVSLSMQPRVTNNQTTPSTNAENIKILEPLHEDKWQQLNKKYSQVHPFPNPVTFLSIRPEDFIIFQKEYQKLVNNSFLLHGFYNYGHLILGKLADTENSPLYLGVPGVYYEHEKQAAQMFGFVGFESTEQPVQAGSYGYYMIEVMI